MIGEAAYFLAERRGFAPGGEIEDWRLAESQIDAENAAGPITDGADEQLGWSNRVKRE